MIAQRLLSKFRTAILLAASIVIANFFWALLGAIAPASAHGQAFPLYMHHASLASNSLLFRHATSSLLANHASILHTTALLQHQQIPARVPGFSGSSSTFYFQAKNLTEQGVVQGLISQISSGAIANGQLSGTIYTLNSLGSTSGPAVSFNHFVLTLGNNPFNSAPPATSIPNPGNNSPLTFTGSKNGKGGFVISPIRLSGSQRIIQNQLNNIIVNGVSAGRTLANTGLTGGVLSGTTYIHTTGTTFQSLNPFVYAFGNSSLNIQQHINVNLPPQTDYLNFKGKINLGVSNFQLGGQAYQPVGALNPPTFPPTLFFAFVGKSNSLSSLTVNRLATFPPIPMASSSFIRAYLLSLR